MLFASSFFLKICFRLDSVFREDNDDRDVDLSIDLFGSKSFFTTFAMFDIYNIFVSSSI